MIRNRRLFCASRPKHTHTDTHTHSLTTRDREHSSGKLAAQPNDSHVLQPHLLAVHNLPYG